VQIFHCIVLYCIACAATVTYFIISVDIVVLIDAFCIQLQSALVDVTATSLCVLLTLVLKFWNICKFVN